MKRPVSTALEMPVTKGRQRLPMLLQMSWLEQSFGQSFGQSSAQPEKSSVVEPGSRSAGETAGNWAVHLGKQRLKQVAVLVGQSQRE